MKPAGPGDYPAKGEHVRVRGHNGSGQPIAFEGVVLGHEHRVDPPIIFVRTSDGYQREGRYGWVTVERVNLSEA
jgi:hypothetical protein